MREETVIVLGFGVFALLLGGWLTRVRARHVARVRADREAGRYIPVVDARGIWLFLNGPVTAALGAAFVLYGGWRARAELEEARMRRELAAIDLRCAPGALRIGLRSEEARTVDVALLRARHIHRDPGPMVRAADSARVALAPGGDRTLELSLASARSCGDEGAVTGAAEELAARAPEGEQVHLGLIDMGSFLFGDRDPIGPRRADGPWPECAGITVDLVIHDADGDELARGTTYCGFPGRDAPLRLDPSIVYR